MASVTWNNFHKILTTEMNSLLAHEDFVDVTLAVEGRYLKAHKMVLSVCSPYFKELFKTSPCKHPIVFLKDVSYSAMSDLLQFMYRGEVQVSQEKFITFIKTAESLQIRGLSNCSNESVEYGIKAPHEEVKPKESEVRITQNELVKTEPEFMETTTAAAASSTLTSEEDIPFKTEPCNEEGVSRFIADDNFNTSAKTVKSLLFKRLSNYNSTACNNERINSVEPEEQMSESSCRSEHLMQGKVLTRKNDDLILLETDSYNEEQSLSVNFPDDPLAIADDTNEDTWMVEEADEEPPSVEGAEPRQEALERLLPEKSKTIYMKVYSEYKDWCLKNAIAGTSENGLLLYFKEQATKKKASTLWAAYSMLKSTILLKENIDITKYFKLMAFIKCKNASYKPKRSSVFTKEQITKFLTEAPDNVFLSTKAILIIGIAGACRTDELCSMHVKDIRLQDDIIIVNIPSNKRKFVIMEPLWIKIVKKYLTNRPTPPMPKVFIGYRLGKFTKQNIGHNTISNTPNKIAKFLKLPNPELYTGHSLRRTSAAILGKMGVAEVVQGISEQAKAYIATSDFDNFDRGSIPSTSASLKEYDSLQY